MGSEVSTDICSSVSRVDSYVESLVGCDRFIVNVNRDLTCHTHMQVVFNLKFNDHTDRRVHEIIVTHCAAAEKLGAGGFARCLDLVHARLSGRWADMDPIEAHHASSDDMARVVSTYAERGGPTVVSAVKEALRLAGFGGRIIIEKTTSSSVSVELVRGYTFDLQQLLPIDVNLVRPRVACIDGYVEEVAEIHHFLEAAAEAKEPCVLFVRGTSDEVKHTLKVNYDRGSLKVVPLGVRFDLEGMNTLVDLATVCGADLVSSLKGNLISAVKFEQLPYVDQITVFRGKTVINVGSTSASVRAHVKNLRHRRFEESIDDVATLLDKRIKSLSPNHVVIRLPDDRDFVVRSQSIDYALRAAKSSIEHGVCSNGRLVATELAARHHSERCVQTLNDIGASLQAVRV